MSYQQKWTRQFITTNKDVCPKSFQLSEVPSLVSQEGNRLRVEAMKP